MMLIGRTVRGSVEGLAVTSNIFVSIVFCNYQVWSPMLPRKQLCSSAFLVLSGAIELVLACV
jgi:hypothetical protein